MDFANAWDIYADKRQQIEQVNQEYLRFLTEGKTEREAVAYLETEAVQSGFVPLALVMNGEVKVTPGLKVYLNYREKAFIAAIIGQQPLEKGLNIIGAHLDAPRLDLKPNPLYEAEKLGWLKTHYYGGIKKYQWVALPLALHGVVFTRSGQRLQIVIGEKGEDPVFTITDLLPHLAAKQMEKKAAEVISGEGLNLLVGSIPCKDKEAKERVKAALLKILKEQYGIEPEDFARAELEAVPAGPAREVGLDRSLIGGFGQDDRVCAWTAWAALRDLKETPEYTAVALLVDKEEIGSTGNTGMTAAFFANFVAELINARTQPYNEILLRRALASSRALSADVSVAVDPNFEGVVDKYNAARLGQGLVVTKYTGARGKSGTSDANAEFVARVLQIFSEADVPWQVGELGAVDVGGGGTIAKFMAETGMDVLDCGVALLSMHSPFEVASKVDIFAAYEGYKAFYRKAGQ